MDLVVHSAMSSLGHVANGANDVIDALLAILGARGTLLMPAHSGDRTDPAQWKNPPVPGRWVAKLRRALRPFDPTTTPVRNRGKVAETFLLYPGVRRSRHPMESVAAKGPKAYRFTATHPLHESEGIRSPLGRLYTAEGHALLIGVDLSSNTALHLAEFLSDLPYLKETRVRALVGPNRYERLRRYPSSSTGFVKAEPDLLRAKAMRVTRDRGAVLRLVHLKPAIDLLVERLKSDPTYLR